MCDGTGWGFTCATDPLPSAHLTAPHRRRRAASAEEKEWFKRAAALKAKASIAAVTEPIRTAAELGALEGVGASTVAKIAAFLVEDMAWTAGGGGAGGDAGGGAGGDAGGGAGGGPAAAGGGPPAPARDPALEWVGQSEREVVLDLLRSGSLTWDAVKAWRADITEEEAAGK